MKKRKSDISKLVAASRDIWRFSEYHRETKKRCLRTSGWYTCEKCGNVREIIRIDHIDPIGKQPSCMMGFGLWLSKLFCPLDNLQGLCTDCYKSKNKADAKALKAKKKKEVKPTAEDLDEYAKLHPSTTYES